MVRKPWRDLGIFKKSHKLIVISNCAIRSHGLVIRSFELDNSFSRIAIRSLKSDNSFSRIAIRSLDFNNPLSRIAIRSLDFNIHQFEGTNFMRENE